MAQATTLAYADDSQRVSPVDAAATARTLARVTRRLVPFLWALYVLGYLDRINISFGKLQMLGDLGLNEYQFGLGSGIFYLGYCLLELPSNLLLERVGARRWIARIMITWGIISAMMMFIRGAHSFYALRILLGAAEAGFFPGIVLYLTYWFPPAKRAKIVAMFLTATALAGVIGSPLSTTLLKLDGAWGLRGWQWLYLLEGIPSIVVGCIVFLYLPDGPRSAAWLSETEREQVLEQLRDAPAVRHAHTHEMVQALSSGRLWLTCAIYFMLMIGLYGFTYYIPTVIKSISHFTDTAVGYVATIPYALAAIAMVVVGHRSDRTGERRWHLAVSAVVSAIGFVLIPWCPNIWVALVPMSLAAMGLWATLGPFWAIPTSYLRGTAAAGGIALVNSVGCMGGFLGPYMIGLIHKRTGSFLGGISLVALAMVLGAVLVLQVSSSPPAIPLDHSAA